MQFDDIVYKSVFFHTLSTCDIENLREVSLHLHPSKCDVALLNVSDDVGVPIDKTHRSILLCNKAFQENVANVLSRRKCNIEKLHMRFKVEEKVHSALLENIAHSLEELQLEGWCSLPGEQPFTSAKSLMCFEKELKSLPKMKSICFSWPRIRRDMLLELESKSVQHIALSGGLKIQRLKCPNLRSLNLTIHTNTVTDLKIIEESRLSLNELVLTSSNQSNYPSFYEDLGAMLRNCPNLRKFKLNTRNQQELRLESSSLKEVDLTGSKSMIYKFACPKLVKLLN